MKFIYQAVPGIGGFVVTQTPAGHTVPVAATPPVLSDTDQAALGNWIAATLNASAGSSETQTAIDDLDDAADIVALRAMLSDGE